MPCAGNNYAFTHSNQKLLWEHHRGISETVQCEKVKTLYIMPGIAGSSGTLLFPFTIMIKGPISHDRSNAFCWLQRLLK